MDDSPWVALVGPFPTELRPTTRWRDRYGRLPRTIHARALAEALADPALDSVILHWNLPERPALAEDVLARGLPLCLPGPLAREEERLVRAANGSVFLGAPSNALPAVRAMRLALGDDTTGPVRYVAVRRLTQPAPGAPHYAPLADALETAASFVPGDPAWVFAQRAERAETTTIIANLHFPAAEVMATWAQAPGGPAHDDWLLYGTKGMVHRRDENAGHTLAAQLFDHWLSVRGGRDEPLLWPEQALTAARLARAVDRSLQERRRIAWQEVADDG